MNKRTCLLGLLLVFASLTPLHAQESDEGSRITFIRDAEIENYLRSLATPIYRAADIDPKSITIAIVQSSAVNAFVAEGMNEFFYTGLLQLADSPEQLAGVIAHETGHISGGHLIRGKEEMRNASAETMLGMLLALAAGAASGNAEIVAGGVAGSTQIASRNFMSFSRAQEASADSAAVGFLDRANISSRGMVEFLHKLAGQEMLPRDRQDEYVRTHPLTHDRTSFVERHWESSAQKNTKLDDKYYVMHERMKAKLLGFLQPETALLRYTDKDPRLAARYARGIALYRTGQTDRALALVDGLIKEEPKNPFFYELKAQIQFENGRIEDSINNYKTASEFLPDSALLRQAYGHALLENKDQKKSQARIDIAIQQLLESNRLEEREPMTWRYLALAWGRKAEATKDASYESMATYALAEEAAARGNVKASGQLAQRAMKGLPKGSTYWLRAQDIKLSAATAAEDKKK
ncbi:MAG: M48 family metalloprotease [Bdellovibrionales bacterium]